jgi:hypothetical protein
MNMVSDSDGGFVSTVIGYPTMNLTACENSQNIISSKWPEGPDSKFV